MQLCQKLNQEQLLAAMHIEGPLLVLAGAGSGKTRVVAYRIAYLIEKGVNPSQILAVTFTNKAAREMEERIYHSLHADLNEMPTICTFHSLGVRILRHSIHHLGYLPNFVIYDEEDSNKLLRGCFQTLNIPKDVDFKSYRSCISHSKNQLQYPNDLDLSELPHEFQNTFPEVYKLYQERLKEANALDFDDLLFLTVQLFQKFPEILATYQERWPYLLIDEYQDTNQAQYMLARLIVGNKRNIFVVGDPDQSIYSWRGANIQNILEFEKDYPGAKIIRLEQNYRSRKNILDAANQLIKHNNFRLEKNLWSEKENGEKIVLFVGDSERHEAEFVVYEMENLHLLHNVPYSDMTIFYRTNFQSRIFEDILLRKRIPYVIVGGLSFYQRKEIKDLLAFLKMVNSDHDFVSFERTVNLPKRGIGLTTIEKLRERASKLGMPIFQYSLQLESEIKLSAKQKSALKEYCELVQSLRALRGESSLERIVIETVRRTHYLDILREDRETYEERKANVDQLVTKAHEWEQHNESNALDAFLEELTLKSSLDEASFSNDKVNLMTLHNGKGLEFHAAFMVGMEEDLFPHVNSRDSKDAIEEERRLCYVGMTRAKERLYLSAASTRFIWGGYRRMHPSRFLREIPREYIDRF